MEDTKVLGFLNSTLDGASPYHDEALATVLASRALYRGEPMGNEVEGRSAIVMKDIQRTVHGALPSIVEPFLGDEIVSIESEIPSQKDGCKKQEALVNYQWARKHNPLEVMETVGINLMVDGTVWLMTGWDSEGYPTTSVVPFESVIPDPAATKPEEMRFVIYRRKVSVSEILSNPDWFGKHTKRSLQALMPDTESEYDPEPVYGRQDDYNPDDRALEKLELFEYYGWYDLDGDGIAEPVLGIWHRDRLLKMIESPFPFGPIPFDTAVYVRQPFSIYGLPISELIGEYQHLRTSITRGIIDNMANSNSGTKFIRKGSLDPVNWNRLKRGEPYVEINVPSQTGTDALIYDGNYNPIPQAVFALNEEIQKEQENLSGITRYAVGSDSRSLNQTATGIGIISSMSQRRLIYITRHLASMMERVFTKWAALNAELIERVVVPTLEGDIVVDGTTLPADGFGIKVTTPTEGLKETKRQQIVSMIQSLAPMVPYTGATPVLSLLSDMAELMDMPKVKMMLARSIQEAEQNKGMTQQIAIQQQQIEQMKAQIEMMKDAAGAQKDQALAQKYLAESDAERYDTILKSYGQGA